MDSSSPSPSLSPPIRTLTYRAPPDQPEPEPPTHPRDGFNALRFSVGISRATSVQQPQIQSTLPDVNTVSPDDPDDDACLVLQPIEICFHASFVPDPHRPLSIHFSNHTTQPVLYPKPPILPTPTPPNHIVDHRLASSIAKSAHSAKATWKYNLESFAAFNWIPEVLFRLNVARDQLQDAVANNDEVDGAEGFFSSTPFDPSQRRLLVGNTASHGEGLDATTTSLAVSNMSDTVLRVLSTYEIFLTGLGQKTCSFFDACSSQDSPATASHPFCQLAMLAPPEGYTPDVRSLAGILEQWRHVQRTEHDSDSNTDTWTASGFSSSGPKEPEVVALARQTSALVSDIDALIQQVRAYGLWDPFGPTAAAAATNKTQPLLLLFWAKYSSRTTEQQAIANIQNATARLARLRNSALWRQEMAAVSTMATARVLCKRLSTIDLAVRDLRKGLGWVRVAFNEAPSLQGDNSSSSGDRQGGAQFCVRASHRVLLTHAQLPAPRLQADLIASLHQRLKDVAQRVATDINRLVVAEHRKQESASRASDQAEVRAIADALGVDLSVILGRGPPETDADTPDDADSFKAADNAMPPRAPKPASNNLAASFLAKLFSKKT
ncbi:hypothetical protein Ct61P_15125 [Colletotrichum tofieldiae]|nr:hypothetical protein Ct61P_15125 [Colletotrichum tofieldiae]